MGGPDVAKARVQTAVLLAAARGEQTGGDFHLIHRHGTLTTVVVGDVMGKGEDAAPYAERARHWLDDCVRDAAEDPGAVLEQLNTLLYADSDFDRYASACVVTIDSERRSAIWAFAGHLPPLWLDTGQPVTGSAPGFLLGLGGVCGATSAQKRPLRSGEGLVLFTDGLEDVLGPGGDRFGSARVTHTLASDLHGASPDEIVDGLKHAACQFGGGELYDDLCIAALRLP